MTRKILFAGWLALALLSACAPGQSVDDTRPAAPFVRETPFQVQGHVRAILRAGPYRYVHCQLDDGSSPWVATLGGSVDVGARVEVTRFGQRQDFHSPRLDRTFETLWFGLIREQR